MHPLSIVLLSEGSIIDLDGTLFLQLGLFFVAFLVLRSLIFKPMVRLFEAREQAIDGAREEAKQLSEKADDTGHAFDEQMRSVRLSAQKERERLRQDGLKLERETLERVRRHTQLQLEEAEARVASDGERLRRELAARVPVLANQIASRLLHREVP